MKWFLMLALASCAATKPCVQTEPPKLVQMECQEIGLDEPSIVGLVCRRTSMDAFGESLKKKIEWENAVWQACGVK